MGNTLGVGVGVGIGLGLAVGAAGLIQVRIHIGHIAVIYIEKMIGKITILSCSLRLFTILC